MQLSVAILRKGLWWAYPWETPASGLLHIETGLAELAFLLLLNCQEGTALAPDVLWLAPEPRTWPLG